MKTILRALAALFRAPDVRTVGELDARTLRDIGLPEAMQAEHQRANLAALWFRGI